MNECGPYRLDIANQCLWRRRDAGGDARVMLTPRAFVLLNYLLVFLRRAQEPPPSSASSVRNALGDA